MDEKPGKEPQSVEIEKQKTLRLLAVVVATLILAVIGIYALITGTRGGGGGKVDVSLKEGKFSLSLERPVVEQIKLEKTTASAKGKDIEFTEGRIKDPGIVEQLKSLSSAAPNRFSGENFINRELGFLLTVRHPEKWQVTYNPAGLQSPLIPVNTIYNQEGSHLNITIEPVPPGTSIQQYMTLGIRNLLLTGVIQQMPVVSYDAPSQTAFAIFTNPMTMGQSYQKVIIDSARNRVFVASANYNQALSSPEAIQDLINMTSTLTLF